MNFLSKMEKKIGKYAIKHLTLYIIMTFAAGYILYYSCRVQGSAVVMNYLYFDPALIARGQVWRIFTWLIVQWSQPGIFSIIMLICYYQLGTILERVWGDFLYNVFIFTGLILTVLGSLIVYWVAGYSGWWFHGGYCLNTMYVATSIFLGFALTFPEQQMLFMFFIPLKIKWLALLDIAFIVYDVTGYLKRGLWAMAILVVCSLVNVALFYAMTRHHSGFSKRTKQRRDFRKAMGGGARQQQTRYQGTSGTTRQPMHRCTICGQTEMDNPNLEFRYCSKCAGSHEYCQNHLFTHTHIK